MGTPLLNTISAASGSANILNSAEGVTFPCIKYPPPIIAISVIRVFMLGFFVKANATLVNGPIGHNVMLLGG